jgi:SAM-dependent methyltransferase
MKPKPKHLGPEYASAFQDKSLVEVYHLRPPYSPEVFDFLVSLIPGKPRAVLDAGCGTGNIARPLAPLVDRIDAVDCSERMIERGKRLPGGDRFNLRWLRGYVEDAPVNPPYALVTAGESLHWMDWEQALPRFHDVLTPKGYLSMIFHDPESPPWDKDLKKIIPRFSTNPDYQPVNLVEDLETRGLFQKHGEKKASPMGYRQALEHYVESFHSMSSLSRDRMGKGKAATFDREVRKLVQRYCLEEVFEMQFVCKIIWGKPLRP